MGSKASLIAVLVAGAALGAAAAWQLLPGRAAEMTGPRPEPEEARRPLYYRNPMDPAVTSPVPMKDSMGMDYIPVYEEEPLPPGRVRISAERIQKIGVASEPVERRDLVHEIRTVGRVEPVEDRVFVVTSKIGGWVERLLVNRTDQMVGPGQRLLELYSPETVAAEEEYLVALKNLERLKHSPFAEARDGAERLLSASRQRLRYLDVTDAEIERLERSGKASRTVPVASPASGSVTEKLVVEGQRIEAGEPLFKVIDHSRVWVYGEIYEYEMPYIKVGQEATLTPSYSPVERHTGRIEHIYSHLGSIRYAPEEGTEVRTAKVRFSLPNRDHSLKLGMYLNVEIKAPVARGALTVPDSAVIDTGERQIVIIDHRDGTFEPVEVRLGGRGDGRTEVKSGLFEGQQVVTSANFLIDSESNLKASLGSMRGPSGKEGKEGPEAAPPKGHVH